MITIEQIRDWEMFHGESFIEYHQYNLNPETHYQILLKTFPELKEILKEVYEENKEYGIELITFQEYIEYPEGEDFSEEYYEKFLQIYCDMVNEDNELVKIVTEDLKNNE